MRAGIKFTKIEHNDDVQEGDIIVVPHERGVKRRVLHLAPSTWSKLGLHATRGQRKYVEAMFGNSEQTMIHVLTLVKKKYCPDEAIFSSVTNKVGTQGVRRQPLCTVKISPLVSIASTTTYRKELREAIKTSLTYDALLCSLPEMLGTDDLRPDIPSASYYRQVYFSEDLKVPLQDNDVSDVFHRIVTYGDDGHYINAELYASACFLTSLKARGASVIRPANDVTRMFIAKMIIKHNSTKLDESIVSSSLKTLTHISKLRKELAHLRNVRKDWKRFFAHTGPMSEASKALAKATGTKKEDVIWN